MADRKKQTKKRTKSQTKPRDQNSDKDDTKLSEGDQITTSTSLLEDDKETTKDEITLETPQSSQEVEPSPQIIHDEAEKESEPTPDIPQEPEVATTETDTAGATASWSSWLSGAQQIVNEKLQSGLNTVIEQVEIGFRGIPPDESDDENDAYTLISENNEKGSDVVVSQENISKMEDTNEDDENKTTDFNEMINEAAKDASKWSIKNFNNIKSKSMNMMTDGLMMLDSLGKQTLESMSNAVGEEDDENDQNLSKILREAKQRSESRSLESEELKEAQQANFSSLFDEYKGLMSLEALESLCKESLCAVNQLEDSADMTNSDMKRIKELFEIIEVSEYEINQDFVVEVSRFFEKLTVNVKIDALIKVHDQIKKDIESFSESTLKDVKSIHKTAIKSMAEYCAITIGIFHKLAQLMLMDSFMDLTQVEAFRNLNKVIIEEVAVISNEFTKKLNCIKHDSIEISTIIMPLTTDIYLEATNTRSYINEAFVLLLPIVQHSILKNNI